MDTEAKRFADAYVKYMLAADAARARGAPVLGWASVERTAIIMASCLTTRQARAAHKRYERARDALQGAAARNPGVRSC